MKSCFLPKQDLTEFSEKLFITLKFCVRQQKLLLKQKVIDGKSVVSLSLITIFTSIEKLK
jgi:hypothetical protein